MKHILAFVAILIGLVYLTVSNSPPPPTQSPLTGEVSELASLAKVWNECAREFPGDETAIKTCSNAVIKRMDQEKVDSVYRRTK